MNNLYRLVFFIYHCIISPGVWKEVQAILPKPLPNRQVLPRPQDSLLRRRTVPLLRDDRRRLGRLPHRWLLQQGEEQLPQLQRLLYPHTSSLPGDTST